MYIIFNIPVKVVPIISQLKEEMSQISEEDHGVKGFKKKLLAGIDERMGHFEEEEQYEWQVVWTQG